MADTPRATLITTEQAARLLMIGPERVRQLVKEGWITKLERDQYQLVDVVQGYIRFRNDEDRRALKSGAEARVRDARAEEIQLRVGLRSGQLMEHAEHVALLREFCALVRSELGGLPARLTRDMSERRKVQQAVYDVLKRLAARADEMARLGRPSSGPVAAGDDHIAGPVGD
jgi:hypothetical protein